MGTKPTTVAYLGERLAGLIWSDNCKRGVRDYPTWGWRSGRRQIGGHGPGDQPPEGGGRPLHYCIALPGLALLHELDEPGNYSGVSTLHWRGGSLLPGRLPGLGSGLSDLPTDQSEQNTGNIATQLTGA